MSRSKGAEGEERACDFLRTGGFDIIDRNVHSRFGEIDIIALKEGVLHFIEVKSGVSYDAAIRNITPQKLDRILKTVQSYMKQHQLDLDYMIDAVVVTPETLRLLENITL